MCRVTPIARRGSSLCRWHRRRPGVTVVRRLRRLARCATAASALSRWPTGAPTSSLLLDMPRESASLDAAGCGRPTEGVARSQAAPDTGPVRRAAGHRHRVSQRARHAVRAFGGKRLGDVTRVDVERLAASLDAKGRSARTCSLTLFVVRSILGAALDDGLVVRNVASKVAASGRAARTVRRCPPTIWPRCGRTSPRPTCIRCGCSAGRLRRSEVLGLRWSDVDMAAGTLTIARGMVPNASGGPADLPTRRPNAALGRYQYPPTCSRRSGHAGTSSIHVRVRAGSGRVPRHRPGRGAAAPGTLSDRGRSVP